MRPTPGSRNGVNLHASPVARVLYLAAGSACLVLAIIGIVTPVLPTTPFVLLAAACYARGSERFHRRLLASPRFGPLIIEWEQHHSIPLRVKLTAIAMMATTLSISIVFFVEPLWLKALLAAFGIGLATWMYRIPSRDAKGSPPGRRR